MTEGHDGGIVSRHLFDQEVFPLLDNPPVSHALDSPLYTRGPLNYTCYKGKEGAWGTLRKEGAPTALHLTPFRIVLSQSDARYPYGLGDVCFVLFVYNFFVPSWNGFCHIIIPT